MNSIKQMRFSIERAVPGTRKQSLDSKDWVMWLDSARGLIHVASRSAPGRFFQYDQAAADFIELHESGIPAPRSSETKRVA